MQIIIQLSKAKLFLVFFLVCLFPISVFSQTVKISGQVVDQNNVAVIGATVQAIGSKTGTVTDLNGHFSLEVKPGIKLHVSYIGFQAVDVIARDGLRVVMKDETNQLNEVVAIGYGSVKRKDVTTAVSTVSTKDLDTRPVVSALQGMEGKAAGLQISQASGQPGASPTIRVRGTTSLNGSNSPLYVVDGVPMTDINFLNADDIDNIQVLKDASSAAIYGSRAANGVIIINTKQGHAGVARITLNAHYAFNKVRDNQNSLNTKDYKDLMDEIGIVKLPDNLTDQTNWKDEVYRTGNVQDYDLAITNGSKGIKYYLSGGYTGETGVIVTSNYKRYNFRAAVDDDIRPWINLSANVNYSDYTYRGTGIISGTGSNRGGVVPAIISTPTYAPIWDPDNPGEYYTTFYGVNIDSPLESLARTKDNKTSNNRLIATGKAVFKILPKLNFTSTYTLDRLQSNVFNFLDPLSTHDGRDSYGTGYDERSKSTVQVFDNVLNGQKSIGSHHFDLMLGSSWTKSTWSESYINGSNYADSDIKTLNGANKISWTGTGTTASDWAILSYFTRLQYNYNDTYMATFNMRADGSSKLAPGHRWGYFPSFSLAWRLSNEKFMKSLSWIDDFKLRGGWGKTGNQSGLGDYSYLASYNINRVQWFGEGNDENAVPTRTQNTLSNPNLTWEKTAQTDIGFDLTILHQRLTFYADYYYKKTTDMLMNIVLPAGSAPARNLTYNGGEIVNKGFEFSLSSKNLTGVLQWNTDFNISFNRNKLTKLKLTPVYYDAKTVENVDEYVVRNAVGHPLGSFWGYIAEGVDPETGNMIYKDVNGDGTISASDRTYIGDPNPDFTYGITNTFSWKGISLNFLLQGSYGNDIYNVSRMETEGMYDGKDQSTRVLKRWRIPGQITNVPKAGWNIKNSTYFLEDGSYLRLKNVTLSYEIPRKYISNIGFTRLMPYVSATNLFTITSYKGRDPEVNQYGESGTVQGIDWGTYPMDRSFVIGVKVEF
ncbi:MAG: TonB-dependent receptor [Prevotella sp.]|jgi:TonB-linked SusC/RagA family outer membrane protein|nr:TonB-dependent receptor [Prevotella sp.]